MSAPSPGQSKCAPCQALVGAGPRIDPHDKLRAKDSPGKYLYRCSLCQTLWTLAAQGWARLMENK
jgi:hypothetical protein